VFKVFLLLYIFYFKKRNIEPECDYASIKNKKIYKYIKYLEHVEQVEQNHLLTVFKVDTERMCKNGSIYHVPAKIADGQGF